MCRSKVSGSSGVGIVAAVAALAVTLFRLYINIHNLHATSYKLKLASFSGSEAKVKQPLRCINLVCS